MGHLSLEGLVGTVGLMALVGLVGLFVLVGQISGVRFVSRINWVGLVHLLSLGCQVWPILGIFLLFYLIQKYFQMEILSLMMQNNLMISKSLMV